jgi:hypothetical protein
MDGCRNQSQILADDLQVLQKRLKTILSLFRVHLRGIQISGSMDPSFARSSNKLIATPLPITVSGERHIFLCRIEQWADGFVRSVFGCRNKAAGDNLTSDIFTGFSPSPCQLKDHSDNEPLLRPRPTHLPRATEHQSWPVDIEQPPCLLEILTKLLILCAVDIEDS